jgi:hypothetical protein
MPDVDALTQGREPDSGIRERLNRVDEMGLLPNRSSFQHKLHIGLYSNYQTDRHVASFRIMTIIRCGLQSQIQPCESLQHAAT